MKVIFRADASLGMGSGHVMRCLTLADALRQRGARCRFICREHAGHMAAHIQQRGYEVTLLPLKAFAASSASTTESQPSNASWLGTGVTQESDARDTLATINGPVDWLVVDHYALDHRWEARMRYACLRLLVIDDLADRSHDCDVLLDQNLGREEADYAALTPGHATKLIGPAYALLRPEFAHWRPYSLARRANGPELRHLLIAMGGVDKDNVTGQVLSAISAKPLGADVRITVVLGVSAPWLEQVRAQTAAMPNATNVLCGVSHMAQLMADADVAIGAAGGTAWERCCLGLPTILLVLAQNQRDGAIALVRQNAAMVAHSVEQVPSMLHQLSAPQPAAGAPTLSALSSACQAVADGAGADRAAGVLLPFRFLLAPPIVREMGEADLPQVLAWRNDPAVRNHMLTQHEISLEEHTRWFARAKQDSSRRLLIVEEDGHPLGYMQFSNISAGAAAEWGFYAVPGAPKGSGRKLGTAALTYAFRVLKVHKVCGQALSTNQTSISFHLRLGFRREGLLREQHFIRGQWVDMVCFGLLASEWMPANTFAP